MNKSEELARAKCTYYNIRDTSCKYPGLYDEAPRGSCFNYLLCDRYKSYYRREQASSK